MGESICVEKCPKPEKGIIPNTKNGRRRFAAFEKRENVTLCNDYQNRGKKADRYDEDSYTKNGPCPEMGMQGEILVPTVSFMHRCVPLEQTQALLVVGQMFTAR